MSGAFLRFANRVLALFRRQPLEGDLDAELKSHLEFATEDNLRSGMPVDEARRQALIRFGGLEQAKEQHRDTRGLPPLEAVLQDLRYSLRSLRRDAGFTTVAVLILALGIGANVSVFSVVNAILVRPLPFPHPQQLTWLATNHGQGGLSGTTFTVAAFEEFQRHNRSFQQVTSYQTFFNSIQYKLQGQGQPQPVFGIQVAENFFTTLGVQPLLGRSFTHEECQKGGRPVALLSYPFWRQRFGGSGRIIGQTITLNDQSVTVVGVLPKTFDFGSVFSPGLNVDFFVPAIMDFWRTWGNTLALVGRLKPGITVAQAQAESNVLFPQLRAAHPDWWEDYTATISELKDHVSGMLRRSLVVLWCAVGLILLIVCVNLSNLLLARGAARSKELAMRRTLGATRARIVQQMFVESLILCAAGAGLGLAFAYGIAAYLARETTIALPLLSTVQIDGIALAWTALIAGAAALLFTVVPAFRISDANLHDALKDSGHGMSQGRRQERLRGALVISEVALACVLLTGAGLLLRSFLRVLDVDLGFAPSRASAIKIDYDDGGKPARRGALFQEILRRVDAIPGIESAGMTDMLPLDRNRSWGFQAKGRIYSPGELQGTLVYVVTPGYFRAMGMRLREGRDFTWHDRPDSKRVVIINQAAEHLHWPGEDATGRMAVVGGTDEQVIGILSNVRDTSVEESASPAMYLPMTQAGPEGAELVVRSNLSPEALQASVMPVLRSVNPGQSATVFRPLQRIVDHATSPRRFFVLLISAFALMGLLLAALGIYGVISYAVTQRKLEIGIRMALGATSKRVQFDVIGRALRVAVIGIAIGTLVSVGAARLIASLLFGTEPSDPVPFAAMLLLLSAVAMLAGYIPARRAAHLDPMRALRLD